MLLFIFLVHLKTMLFETDIRARQVETEKKKKL